MKYTNIQPSGSDTALPLNLSRRVGLIAQSVNLKDKYILDCGCGKGSYIIELLKYTDNVFGIEYDEDKVKEFKALNNHSENVCQGNLENLEFEDERFDVVLLNEVLEHVSDEKKALREIYRVLKRDGFLVIFSPNRLYPFETHGVTIKRNNMTLPHYFPFIPYIPLALGDKIFKYNARNYFPWELENKIIEQNFAIVKHLFMWQTFENISGKMPNLFIAVSPFLRRVSFVFEKIPLLKMFGVSQIIVAKKPAK